MKYISFFFSLFLLANVASGQSQKKIKPFQASEIKKGDLSAKAFRDFPLSNERMLFDYGQITFVPKDDAFTIERSRHIRIKILSDTALSAHQLGLTSFDKDEIVSFEHYSLVDGNIEKKDLSEKWATINKYLSLVNQLDDFHSGDILEFKFKANVASPANIPSWQFEYEIPVDYSEFYAEVPGMFKYRPIFKGYVPLDVNSSELLKDENKNWIELDGFYIYQNRFVCTDIAPFKKTVYSPSSKNYLTSVDFYLDKIEAYKSYKPVKGQSWEMVSQQLYSHEKIYGRVKEFDAKPLLQRLELDSNKVRSTHTIYNWVSATFSWNGDIGIFAEHTLDELVEKKSGSIAEINLLLCALLEEAGIFTRATILRTIDQGGVNMELPNVSQFNYLIAWIDLNGEKVVLDASESCLFTGILRPICLNNKGLKITPRFEEWVSLDNDIYAKSTIVCAVKVKDDQLIADVNVSNQNYFAYEDCMTGNNYKELIHIEPGVTVSEFSFIEKDSIPSVNRMRMICTGDSAVEISGSTWTFNPFWVEKVQNSPFIEKERKFPIVFPYLFEYNWNFVLELGENCSVSSFPKSEEIMMPDKSIRFIYNTIKMDDILQINVQLRIMRRTFEPEVYDDILDFYNALVDKMNKDIKIKVKS